MPTFEAQIHTDQIGGLEDEHPMANIEVRCIHCDQQVHAFNNECMTEWFETGIGAICFECFVIHHKIDELGYCDYIVDTSRKLIIEGKGACQYTYGLREL